MKLVKTQLCTSLKQTWKTDFIFQQSRKEGFNTTFLNFVDELENYNPGQNI